MGQVNKEGQLIFNKVYHFTHNRYKLPTWGSTQIYIYIYIYIYIKWSKMYLKYLIKFLL
jgi:hypothetical protein